MIKPKSLTELQQSISALHAITEQMNPKKGARLAHELTLLEESIDPDFGPLEAHDLLDVMAHHERIVREIKEVGR